MSDENESIPSMRWSWSRFTWLTIAFAAEVATAVDDYLDNVAFQAAAHHNWTVDQDAFAKAARREIESITEGK